LKAWLVVLAFGILALTHSAHAFLHRATQVGDLWDAYVIHHEDAYYLDDLLVQTFHIPEEHSGRLGFVVQSGTVELRNLQASSMSLTREVREK
jgi:hypothetical protein